MRLFDKVASQGSSETRELFRNPVPSFAVLNVDDIACYYASSHKDFWRPEDFPYATPPWTDCFIEWSQPNEMVIGGKSEPIDVPGLQVGALVMHRSHHKHVDDCRKRIEHLLGEPFKIDCNEYSVVTLEYKFFRDGRVNESDVTSVLFLQEGGLVEYAAHVTPTKPVIRTDDKRSFDTFLHIIGLAFTFANCKNCELSDATEELQPTEKIRRRLRIPEVKRYTLNIAGQPSRARRSGPVEDEGIMPYHLCRGHFATYTNEKPLFGKYAGRFWIPPHMKGKKENGEIVKDYSIDGMPA